ncbi:DNA replication/repair protein RecF [Garciella nitratireducens]|uniref:DNA replication and repair protein RecF n=1 Tax=Garciella nitratireducens DSM 15102 TaxID=1121911 RepID=A0A1T4PDJ5_9FIRM|nr:DNA replication/repair protein RecF [Garciella nitratireducens]SJZ89296.1 DNA replication and repair protein RecF [Garciella nitratireducens DSM 15102]
MYIEKLIFQNYRNYSHLKINLHPKMNIFVGKNAQGKTNILESVYLLSTGKSHRSSKDQEMIKWDKENAFIKGEIITENKKKVIEIGLSKNQKKKIKMNGVPLKKRGDLLGQVHSVLFCPEDLKLVKGSPNERRNFLDQEISNLRPRYYYYLLEYNKILKQRNFLLKRIKYKNSFKDTLYVWDQQLVEIGSKIILTRIHFLKKINEFAKNLHTEITNNLEQIELFYQSTVLSNKEDIKNIKDVFQEKLKKNQIMDIQRGTTTIGPHRDDIKINVNQIDIRSFGSQGQQRTAALSLKLSIFELIHLEIGEYPILLLDDVMSELDQNRQNKLMDSLKNIQSLITCTDLNFLKENYPIENQVYQVKNGQLSMFS